MSSDDDSHRAESDLHEFVRPDSIRDEIHRGHDLESGMLERLREWTDLAPWLRLGRTLRAAGSPTLILATALVMLIWWPGATWLLGDSLSAADPALQLADISRWQFLSVVAWSLWVWAPAALLLTRQGALLTAGRTMLGFRTAVTHAIKRTPAAWLAALAPAACIFAMGLPILVIGWTARLAEGIFVLEWLLALAAAALALPCGILAFGACAAVPLSWAALGNERDPDALDSLSRGYEAVYRRPLKMTLYLLLAAGILGVVGLLAMGIGAAAAGVASLLLDASGCPSNMQIMTGRILRCFPLAVIPALMWSLLGGIYLLLRYDTGRQEVEDIWQPAPQPEPPLPEIPSEA